MGWLMNKKAMGAFFNQHAITDYAELPVVSLSGDFTGMDKENKKAVRFTYRYKGQSISGYSLTSWQGNSSLEYEKKSYAVTLYKDKDLRGKLKIGFGNWEKDEHYVLKANWVDFSAARNIVSGRLYGRMPNALAANSMSGVQDGFPVNLYINGVSKGLYTIVQPKKKTMFGLKNKDEKKGARLYAAEEKSGSAIFENSSEADEFWELKFPSDKADKTSLNRLTKFISTCTYNEFKDHIEEYMDLDSLLNYMVLSFITLNADGWRKNYNIVTYDGKIWYIRPYDLDCTFGISSVDGFDGELYLDTMSDWVNTTRLWYYVKVCFPREIYDRYLEVRYNQLNEKVVIDAFIDYMNSVGADNYKLDNSVWHRHNSQREELSRIYDFVYKRYDFLDGYMKYEYDHPCWIEAVSE